MKILVAEDEAVLAFQLETDLTNAGHQVIGPAATAEKALLLAQATEPDLALVDIKLADDSDGVALARLLLERFDIPSLFLSGSAEQARAAQDVAIGYIPKPYLTATVLAAIPVIEAILAGHQPTELPPALELFQDRRPDGSRTARLG